MAPSRLLVFKREYGPYCSSKFFHPAIAYVLLDLITTTMYHGNSIRLLAGEILSLRLADDCDSSHPYLSNNSQAIVTQSSPKAWPSGELQ